MITSIQQAAVNAFGTWLQARLPDVKVEKRWVANDKNFPSAGRVVSIIPAGARRDTAMDLRQISRTNNGANNVDTIWQIASCMQPLQLDVWATSHVGRDDIIALLDNCLHLGDSYLTSISPFIDPVGYGVALNVADGWETHNTVADFTFEDPEIDDVSDDVGRSIFRARYSGTADFMLTVKTTTARQKRINFRLFLDGLEFT